jgi:hypothetical protein
MDLDLAGLRVLVTAGAGGIRLEAVRRPGLKLSKPSMHP